VYALGSDSVTQPDASAYGASVPRAKDAGTYYVWYKTEAAAGEQGAISGCLTATIWKADIAILADDVIGPDPQTASGSPLTWHVSGALAAGDEEGLGIQLSLGEPSATSPRTYPIRVSHNDNANYNITTREGVYTVDEALRTRPDYEMRKKDVGEWRRNNLIAQFKAAGLELTPDVWERLAADRRQALEDDLALMHP
jgi:hypothetical protein